MFYWKNWKKMEKIEKTTKIEFLFLNNVYYSRLKRRISFEFPLCNSLRFPFKMAAANVITFLDVDITNVNSLVSTTQGTIDAVNLHRKNVLTSLMKMEATFESNTITSMKVAKQWLAGYAKVKTMQIIGKCAAGDDVLFKRFVNVPDMFLQMSKVNDHEVHQALMCQVNQLRDDDSLTKVQETVSKYLEKVKDLLDSYDQFCIGVKCKAVDTHKFHMRQIRNSSSADVISEIPVSTRPCYYFRKGKCRHGTRCRFAHNFTRIAAPAAASAAPHQFNPNAPEFVTIGSI